MHRRLSGFLLAALLLISISGNAAAGEVLDGMNKKFRRGVTNTFSGWIELPYQIVKGYNEGFLYDRENKLGGILWGTLEGITHSVGRTLSGITEVLGFWAADPIDNSDAGTPFDADYAWQEGVPYDMFDPNFTEAALKPTVNKFLRGVGNTVFGFLEVPAQIKKGIFEGDGELSIIRGFWFWASREVSGLSDIFTACLPGPEDTIGATFDEECPWDVFTEE